jgi:hypothetical protein
MWIPTGLASGRFLFIISLVDLGIAIALARGQYLQSTFLPYCAAACADAETWQVPKDTPSLFHILRGANATEADTINECEDFVEEWRVGIGVT